VDVVPAWTGQLAVALQRALRLSQESFAETLGVGTRTVAKWQENPDAELRPATQEILDTALARAGESVRQRFALIAGGIHPMSGAIATASTADVGETLFVAASESSATPYCVLAISALRRCRNSFNT
jgi:transcriptional regulator with XRE-family HTH domain